MEHLDFLPEIRLSDAGAIGRRFLERGVTTFRAACLWVRDVPYGSNSARRHADVVFDEMRGTCQSKHDLIAALARELDLGVGKYAGAYRLDESIVEGAGAVLAAHGLTYVPQVHCVLKYGERFFDLTAGNCHGKKRDVTEMDLYVRVDPFASPSEDQAIYELCAQYYRRVDPIVALKSVDQLRRIARECHAGALPACVPEYVGSGSSRTRQA